MTCTLVRHSGTSDTRGHDTLRDVDPSPALRRRPLLGRVVGLTVGWTVVVLGVVLMPLPGPGTLIVVAGLRILVPHHRWAAASYDRVRDRAVAAARTGVATVPRVAGSIAGVVWIAAVSGLYAADVSIPRTSVAGLTIGPSLPFHSTATVVGLVVSSLAAAGATVYSIARLRPPREPVAV